jgi:uncharacterized protein
MLRKNLALSAIILCTVLSAFCVHVLHAEAIRRCFPYGNYVHHFKSEPRPKIERIDITSQTSYSSNDTIVRKGILVHYPNAQANLVISHGFMCDKFDVGFLRSIFPKGKFNFLTYDFRAHGEHPEGQLCTFGRDEALDVQAAARYLKNHPELSKLPTLAYGFSMGAVATIEAQAKDPSLFKGLVLDCPFDSTENIVKKSLQSLKVSMFGYEMDLPGRTYLEKYAFHPYVQSFIKFMLKTVAHMDSKNIQTFMYRFSPAESVKKITAPCLFIHCKYDQRVPVDAIKSIFNGARGQKQLWITNGRGHYDSVFFNPEKYAKRVGKFYEEVLKKIDAPGSQQKKVVEDVEEECVRNLMQRRM